jgi:hypothetical protein
MNKCDDVVQPICIDISPFQQDYGSEWEANQLRVQAPILVASEDKQLLAVAHCEIAISITVYITDKRNARTKSRVLAHDVAAVAQQKRLV